MSLFAQLGFFVLLAASSDIAVVGSYAVVNACWVLGRALLPMGWNVAILRRIAVLRDQNVPRDIRKLLLISIRETAALGGVIGISVTVVAFFVFEAQTVNVVLAAVVGILWAEIGVVVAYLRAHGELIWSQLCDGIIVHVFPLAICGVLLIVDIHFGLELIILSYLASALLSIGFLALVGYVRLEKSPLSEAASPMSIRDERRLAHRLWWNQAFAALSGRASVFLAAPLAGIASTAIVEAGLRTQLVGATLAWAGGTVASPRYAVGHSKGQAQGPIIMNVVTWAALLPSLLVVVGLVIWGDPLLGILGQPFVTERWAIVLMAVAAVVEVPAASAGYYLMMTGRERVASLTALTQLAALVVLASGLGPSLGAFGIALAVLLAAALRSCLVLASLHRGKIRSPLSLAGLTMLFNVLVVRLRFR